MLNTILKGDVLEVLESFHSNFIDMGVTSPPYNKKKVGGGIFRKIEYENFDDNLPEGEYQQKQINVLNELYRIIKEGGSLFYNHKIRYYKGKMIHPLEWLTKTD
jgi:modification methylase